MKQTLEFLETLRNSKEYAAVANVCVPDTTLDVLSYGADETIKPGSLVWVSLRGRKRQMLALVLEVHKNYPDRKLKPAALCETDYVFSKRYLETLNWCANYYMCSLGEALTACWPAELEKYLDNSAKIGSSKWLVASGELHKDVVLTNEQRYAVDILNEMLLGSGFRGALLHGVTGSGKTRVYLELTRKALDLGMKVLILVPEINLTPQTRKRFEDFLGMEIPILHSALGAKQKRETWKKLLTTCQILMGTRSAILAPFEPQLIIIDEEHDSSYKQQDPAPRYNVREMAFHIAHKYGALVVLGSATPCMETYSYAKSENLKLIEMKTRPGGLPLPKVTIVDMKEQRKKQDKDLMLSSVLRDALAKTVSSEKQAIILMNRRGYSTGRICEECGEPLECNDCKVQLVYHKQHGKLMCHYCGRLYPTAILCKCGSGKFVFLGNGIEKAEDEIKEWLPGAKILRLDSDTTGSLGATEKLLRAFRNKEANVLLGTQMVAKGHDFPDVSLVGVLSADIGSAVPDFRASERYFQLLTQVAGRAGRSTENAEVIIQTFCPENPVMQFAIKHNYSGFVNAELAERKEAVYPPFCKIAQIKMQSRDKEKLDAAAKKLVDILKPANHSPLSTLHSPLSILGPVEPFISIAQKMHRLCITVKSADSGILKKSIKNALEKADFKGVDVRVDRDA